LHSDPKKKASGVGPPSGSRKLCAELARKNFRIEVSENFRRAHKTSNAWTRPAWLRELQEIVESLFFVRMQDIARVQRRDAANFAHLKNRAKGLQNFRKSGTPRAQKLRALGQRALCILHDVAES